MGDLIPLLLGAAGILGGAGGGLALYTAATARRIDAALPPRGRFVDVDGSRIHYVDRGAGPAVVLIHGLAGNLGHFTYGLMDRLTSGFRVVALDRPGSGHSTRAPGASARLGAQAETVAGFIRALGLERPLLVGHSLGGAVALATALNHPDHVGGLALISPLTQVRETPPAVFRRMAIRSALLRRIVAWTLATPTATLTMRTVLAEVFAPDPVPHDFATAAGGLLSLRPRSFFGASTDLAAVNDDLPGLVERYPSLRVPVGVLFGTGDRILDHRLHGRVTASQVPGLELELVDGGHMLPLTAVDACVELVRRTARRTGAIHA